MMKQPGGRDLLGLHADSRGGVALLDVREPCELTWAANCGDGSTQLHVALDSMTRRFGELDASQPVVCMCHHGVRSAQVVEFLANRGFAAVSNLAGGNDAWSGQVDPGVPRY